MPGFDVIVIGGGTAGTAAAAEASRHTKRVALVNDGELGGLCILRGCMPTKSMLASAHAAHEVERLVGPNGFRVRATELPEIDFAGVMARKNAHVERFKRAKISSIESGDYELICGRARFVRGGDFEVDGEKLRAKRFVIATGSQPVKPDFGDPDLQALTSDDVMRMGSRPDSLIVVGSGAIGLELGQFFARMGTEVTLLSRASLLHRFDRECGRVLSTALRHEPRFTLLSPARVVSASRSGSRLQLTAEIDGNLQTLIADELLLATGRRADLDDLGLEHVGLEPLRDELAHDAAMRTENPAIYVAGDATGRHKILHLASEEGRVAGFNAARGAPGIEMDYRLEMGVVFTDPPFAQVGLTQPEVDRRRSEPGCDIVTSEIDLSTTGRAITMAVEHGVWRMHADRQSCEILGSAIVGPRADELIHVVSTLMHFHAKVDDIAKMPWYHPTVTEVIINHARQLAAEISDCEAPPAPPA